MGNEGREREEGRVRGEGYWKVGGGEKGILKQGSEGREERRWISGREKAEKGLREKKGKGVGRRKVEGRSKVQGKGERGKEEIG